MSTPTNSTRPPDASAADADAPAATPAPFPLPPRPRRLPDETPTLPAREGGAPPSDVRVGRYRIDGEIARGGMGAVLRAHDPDLGRDLAVKVLLEGLEDNPELVRRFLDEARVGGTLQHPGVVPVYEVGRCADSRPYFAMKLIEGLTLHALLRDRAAPTHDLPRFLKVFEQICQAVAYAHSKGVVHRDLKPLNVMVGAFGEVQVMDWGLAKAPASGGRERPAEDGWSGSDPAASRPGAILGTPAYMAPEQAAGAGGPPDPRGDVFGLGAVLCEILTRAPPYRGGDSREVLCKAAAADLDDAFARLDGCGADPDLVRLAKACLAADPAGRPRDAGAVADAMTAYLAGVQERLRAAELERAAARARAEEERKRRRLALALAAAVVAVVLTAGGGWAWVALERAGRRTRADRDVTAALRDAAALREKARQAPPDDRAFWPDALAAARRVQGLAANGDVSEELQGQVRKLLAEVEDEARDRKLRTGLEEARLQWAVVTPAGALDREGAAALYAAAFREAGLDAAALEPEEAADRIRRRPAPDDLTAALVEWAELTPDADLRRRLLRVADALDPNQETFLGRWRAAVAQYEGRRGGSDRDALVRLAASADVDRLAPAAETFVAAGLAKAGAPTEATDLLRRSRRLHPDDFWINFQLAYQVARTRPAPWGEAVRFFSVAQALRPRSAAVHSNLALALEETGRLAEAEEAGLKAVELQPNLAEAHLVLGLVRQRQGQLDGAEKEYRTAIALRADLAEAHADLGGILAQRNRMADAKAECARALEANPNLALAHSNLGGIGLLEGRLPDAEAECRKALGLAPDLPEAHFTLAQVLEGQGRRDEAEAECDQVIAGRPDFALAHVLRGNELHDRGRAADAEAEYRRALDILPGLPPANAGLGFLRQERGRFAESLAYFRKAQEAAAKRQDLPLPYGDWVRKAERLRDLDARLPAILAGAAEPADAGKRLGFAEVCRDKRLYGAATDLAAAAFADRPALAADLLGGRRYDAACGAALGGCGRGEDGDRLGPDGRARLQRQALDWLRADLKAWEGLIAAGGPAALLAARRLHHWQIDPDLAGVRDADALAKLPPAEQDAWGKLWKDVDGLLDKAAQ